VAVALMSLGVSFEFIGNSTLTSKNQRDLKGTAVAIQVQ